MSVLDTPRIYFRGQITWDPIVTNNYPQLYDVATSKPILGMGTVADYRERARQAVPAGNWNMHGTHRSTFFETTVTGVDLGDGLQVDDALVGVPVSFSGKLVDLDPYGATTSQLFFDEFSCGIEGGSQILAHRGSPMVARRINFARNTVYQVIAGRASVIWQASFYTGGGLSVQPRGSDVLAGLHDLFSDDEVIGLTVRFNAYRTVYYDTEAPTAQQAQDLADQIAQGGFHPNPARSLIVGVIGLWRAGEAPAVPGDRVLARVGDGPVWTAFARVSDGRLTIDLGNSVPETSFDVPKLDLGPLTVVAKAEGKDVPLGTLDYAAYDAAAYAATSGIVTLPLDSALVAATNTADLEVRAADGTALLTEQPLTVVADPPTLYLEEGEQASVSLRALLRGQRPGAPVSVTMVEVDGPLPPLQVQTDENGEVTIPLNGGKSGSWTWVLVPWQGAAPTLPTGLDTAVSEYLALRVTPADAEIAALAPTWENVHQYVLRNWEALAPCMDNWLRLGDEQQCRTYARLVRRLTSRERFDDYGYMPVTRELTRGQRTLLHAWCDAVTGEVTATRPAFAAEEVAAKDPFGRGF
ncbi:MAG TPA: hypothetical protein VJT72_24100 [Pseudonocardiaceae bacterium]|nr:hypothetical protein [Pseudonocardiaceae bacterium]